MLPQGAVLSLFGVGFCRRNNGGFLLQKSLSLSENAREHDKEGKRGNDARQDICNALAVKHAGNAERIRQKKAERNEQDDLAQARQKNGDLYKPKK